MRAIVSTDALIDLNDAALFVQVVQASSFSAAGASRGVPVSTVSRRIARLEARLGARLLERTTRRLRLTDVGRTYFAHAERAVEELVEGSQQVRALDIEPRGRVRITAPAGMGPAITRALAPYLARTPHVDLELDLSERRVDLLAEGFDIAVRSGEVDSPDHVARRLFSSPRHLLASKAYLERRGTPRRLADLARHDLIAMRATESGATWDLVRDAGGRRARFAFTPRLYVNEMMAARSAASAGVGIALLPLAIGRETLVRVLPGLGGAPAAMWLLYPARRRLTAAVRTCVEHLLATLQPTA